MKTINETFTDEEFEAIEAIKKESGLTWRQFIYESATNYNKRM